MNHLINYIVKNPFIHPKWLNTISYIKNDGVKKISTCKHRKKVDLIQNRLDIEACHYLKNQFNITGNDLKYGTHHFVTYTIEVRANELPLLSISFN